MPPTRLDRSLSDLRILVSEVMETTWSHPDPGWWKKLPQSNSMYDLDICDECGHVRKLHGRICLSPSAGLTAPRGVSCLCENPPSSRGWRTLLEPKR